MMVVRKNGSRAAAAADLARNVQANSTLLGTVLNEY